MTRAQHLPPQKDDSDILATCQTPDALTPYWQARYLALDPATDLLVHVIEGTKKPQNIDKNSAHHERCNSRYPHAAPVSPWQRPMRRPTPGSTGSRYRGVSALGFPNRLGLVLTLSRGREAEAAASGLRGWRIWGGVILFVYAIIDMEWGNASHIGLSCREFFVN